MEERKTKTQRSRATTTERDRETDRPLGTITASDVIRTERSKPVSIEIVSDEMTFAGRIGCLLRHDPI